MEVRSRRINPCMTCFPPRVDPNRPPQPRRASFDAHGVWFGALMVAALPSKHHVGQSPLGVRTTASVALKSASYANSDVIVLPPKPLPPFFLERTHFYSRCAPTELVAAVENAVQTSGVVDVVFDRQKCKWKIDLCVGSWLLGGSASFLWGGGDAV